MHTPGSSSSGYLFLISIQIVILIVFAVYATYKDELLPQDKDVVVEKGLLEKHVPSYPR